MKFAPFKYWLFLLLLYCGFSFPAQAQEVVMVRQGLLWGMMNGQGKMVQLPQFEAWFPVFHNRSGYSVRRNGKWGLTNAAGEIITEPVYDKIYWSPDQPKEPEFVKVRIGGAPTPDGRGYCGGKMGIVNHAGNVIIEPRYDVIYWNNWMNCFLLATDRYSNACDDSYSPASVAYADKTGKLLEVDENKLKEERQLPVTFRKEEIGGKFGYRNETGTLIPFTYDDIIPEVRNSLVAVNIGSRPKPDGYYGERSGGKWGLVNLNNKVVVPLQYDDLRFLNQDRLAVRKGGNWGLIDTKGRQILPFDYELISGSGKENADIGFAIVTRKYNQVKSQNLLQLINTNGEPFSQEQFSQLVYQDKGVYWIGKQDQHYIFLNAKGEAKRLSLPKRFKADLYQLQKFGRNSLLSGSSPIGPDGTPIHQTFFIGADGEAYQVRKFSQHNFGILLQHAGKWGFLDTAGTLQMETKFETVIVSPEGLNWGKLNGQWHLYSGPGKPVKTLPAEYQEVRPFTNGFAAVSKGGEIDVFGGRQNAKWGFVNAAGEVVIDCHYEGAKDFGKSYGAVKVKAPEKHGQRLRNGYKWALINRKGEVIGPLLFDEIGY